MNGVTFSRTESWTSGWRGKASVTDIRFNGNVVGTIKGRENAGLHAMEYCVEIPDRRHLSFADSLQRAKIEVRQILEGRL